MCVFNVNCLPGGHEEVANKRIDQGGMYFEE
jgi:hypothetical protein